jgi:DNA-binding NarL/FixJ family response regulator
VGLNQTAPLADWLVGVAAPPGASIADWGRKGLKSIVSADMTPNSKVVMMTDDNKLQTPATLSDREVEIIELVTAGLTNKDIADRLEISKRTVDNHISNILEKAGTGVDNRVALVRWALQWGKVCLDDINCCALPDRE